MKIIAQNSSPQSGNRDVRGAENLKKDTHADLPVIQSLPSCSDSVLYGYRLEVGPTSMVPYRIRLPRSKRHALQDYRIKSAAEDVNMQSQDAKEENQMAAGMP